MPIKRKLVKSAAGASEAAQDAIATAAIGVFVGAGYNQSMKNRAAKGRAAAREKRAAKAAKSPGGSDYLAKHNVENRNSDGKFKRKS
jgi:hypothetical protein